MNHNSISQTPLVRLLAVCLTLLFISLASRSFAIDELEETMEDMKKYEWKLVRNLNDIQVYMKHRDESKIKSFLAKTVMEVPDPYALPAVVEDFEAAPQWLHMVSELTEINRHTNELRDIRLETRLPWPVKDRDTVLNAVVSQNPENNDISIKFIQDDSLLAEYPGYIRMPEVQGEIKAKALSGQRMEIEMEFLMDPGGYIPPIIGNLILKDFSYYSLKKLKGMLLKEKYQNKKSIYESWIRIPDNYNTDSYMHPSEKVISKTNVPSIKGNQLIPQ